WRFARRGEVAPGRAAAVDQCVKPTDRIGPLPEHDRCRRLIAIVDEAMVDAMTIQPLARLAAGVAVVQSVDVDAHARSNSLMAVFERVCSSTRLTMMAAYRLWLPSAAGKEPATTTLPAGTRPQLASPLARS